MFVSPAILSIEWKGVLHKKKNNKLLLVVIKSNYWSTINDAFWLVELLLGYMLQSMSSEKWYVALKIKTMAVESHLADVLDKYCMFLTNLGGYY